MPVRVMHVRHVRMRVAHRRVLMKMGVRLGGRGHGAVSMAMVLVMDVGVGMRHRAVNVLMLVMLGEVQPHPDCHQNTSEGELWGHWLTEASHRCRATEERCRGKICAGPRGSEMAQR